ncbi:hypothetical protein L210DRAFT_3509783 [Boletus edulis BED1]|uniref:Uncharacterized protein n=1 Tax=Boletus edulis BED1 TaxID=1328754 RepID=A0AAD4G7H1_BOLED|nr:hypothetical protein L210DRAFT_3509783 [Boletus edulis BED1]
MTRTRLSLACLTFLSFLGRLTGLGSGPQAFGGGPPAIKTGDVLVAAGVNLVTAHGGTKVGLLSRVLQDSTEQSLQERIQSGSDRNLRWVVSQGDETYECQMLRVRDMTELGKKTTLEQFHALWSLSRKDERQHSDDSWSEKRPSAGAAASGFGCGTSFSLGDSESLLWKARAMQ